MWMILLLLMACAVSPAVLITPHSYYIVPTTEITCKHTEALQFEACLTLQQFSEKNLSGFIDRNVTLTFALGRHFLIGGVVFRNTTEVILEGKAFELPQITCEMSSCFSFINVSNVHIENLTFRECHSQDYYGGAVFAYLTQFVNISQCFFAKNIANAPGGAVRIVNSFLVHITQSKFISNSAVCGPADAFHFSGFKFCTRNCTGQGGAISVNNVTKVVVEDSVFNGNNAYTVGGALSSTFSSVSVRNTSFTRNTAVVCRDGGGALVIFSSNVEVSSSVFQENQAFHGGAIFSPSSVSVVIILNSFFTLNKANFFGGACYFNKNNLHIVSTTFESNTARTGGAVTVDPSKEDTSDISNSTFLSNTGTNGGGALYLLLEGTPTCTTQCTNSEAMRPTGNESVVTITNCVFRYNGNFVGGAIQVLKGVLNITESIITEQRILGPGGAVNADSCFLYIHKSKFSQNSCLLGGALYVSKGILISSNNTFAHNNGDGGGGALFAIESTIILANDLYDSITGDLFVGNTATNNEGAAIFQIDGSIHFQNTTFTKNNALGYGQEYIVQLVNARGIWDGLTLTNNQGSLYLLYSVVNFTGAISLTNNTGVSGGALTLVQSTVTFDQQSQVNISNNIATESGGGIFLRQSIFNVYSPSVVISENVARVSGGGLFCYQSQLKIESDCHMLGCMELFSNWAVEGGAMHQVSTNLNIFKGHVRFTANEAASSGGAIFLSDNSRIYILKTSVEDSNYLNVSLSFSSNTADYGGAIYVSDSSNAGILCDTSMQRKEHPISSNECFIQTLALYYSRSLKLNESNSENIFFLNNTGSISGSAVFGGLLDRCQLNPFAEILYFNYNCDLDGICYFKEITRFGNFRKTSAKYSSQITREGVRSLISSNSTQLCFCFNNIYNCSAEHPNIFRKRGERFSVRVVTVDQVENPINGTVLVRVISSETRLDVDQSHQQTNGFCTELFYNVFSTQDNVTIQLYPDGPCGNVGISSKELNISFLPCECPNGLQPAPIDNECRCECDSTLDSIISQCLLDNDNLTVIRRTADVWIEYEYTGNSSGFVYSECPFDYCLVEPVNLSFSLPSQVDMQCAYNRSGVLCGECEEDLSLVFGSSRCTLCNDNYLALLIAFAVAGIALVAFILVLNLTVAVGTIHGLILYANIVAANSPIFLPSETALRLFVSWVNLDLGIETCFYDGMDSDAKVLLQLVFPAYVIFLSVLIIVTSFYWGRFAGLIGRKNPVATLCTLFLLSYSKLLQTIIASLQFAKLTYPSGVTEVLWLYNPNIPYFTPARIPMFIIAGVITILGTLYTIMLLFGQWLRKLRRVKCFRNTKFIAFIDAYHAPFSFKHRYWIGVLLFTRIVHHLLTAVLSESTHPLVVSCLMCMLLILKQLITNSYKNWILDFLETSFLVNILLFAISTYYSSLTNDGDQVAIANTSVATAFITFCGIILFHSHSFFLKSFNIYQTLLIMVLSCSHALKQMVNQCLQSLRAQTRNDSPTVPIVPNDDVEEQRMALLREPALALDIISPVKPEDYGPPPDTLSNSVFQGPVTTTVVDIKNTQKNE